MEEGVQPSDTNLQESPTTDQEQTREEENSVRPPARPVEREQVEDDTPGDELAAAKAGQQECITQ